MLTVTRYRYSARHERTYAHGTKTYDGDGGRRTLRMSYGCVCGDPIDDGEQVCDPAYQEGRIVHVNCCKEHDHA